MTSTVTGTRTGLAASLACARHLVSRRGACNRSLHPGGAIALSAATVNLSSNSCVVSVGGFDGESNSDTLFFGRNVVRWIWPVEAASETRAMGLRTARGGLK
jgi:hypothetical protein